MRVTLHELTVPLQRPFTISRGTLTEQDFLVVELEKDGITGFGEATSNDYYGHSIASIRDSIESVLPTVSDLAITNGDEVWTAVGDDLSHDTFALSAIDMASHDLAARRAGRRSHEHWNLGWSDQVESSLTLGIGTLESMVAELQSNPGWKSYKVKLGTDNDLEIIQALREATDANLRVDANCAWSADETVANSHEFARLGVEFIEQPLLPDASAAELQQVSRESKLPIIADESCQTIPDVERCVGYFHGINVKLCKCGGITPALRMLKRAKMLGLKTMVGCMVETSIGISAAAHLLPLLDYADLDGALLLGNDPAQGVVIDEGRVLLSDEMGSGAQLK